MMYGWGHGNWVAGSDGWGWMIFGWLWMLVVFLIPLFIVLALGKYLFGKREQDSGKNAQAILDEAYARGELTREDYLQKKNDLRNLPS